MPQNGLFKKLRQGKFESGETTSLSRQRRQSKDKIDLETAYLRRARRDEDCEVDFSEELSEEEGEEGVRTEDYKQRVKEWNTCLHLSCFVLLLLVCNILFLLYLDTRRV